MKTIHPDHKGWQVSKVINHGPDAIELQVYTVDKKRKKGILKPGEECVCRLINVYFGKGIRSHYEILPVN